MDSKEAIKIRMAKELQEIADALNYAIASIDRIDHLNKVCKLYEEKLKSLMKKGEFERYVTSIARDMFLEDINNMADSEFKDFCINNFGLITGKEPGDEDITGIDPNSES